MKSLIFILIMLSISFSLLSLLIPTVTTTNRSVSVQSRHENGLAIINNIKYKVKYTIEETLIPGKAEDIMEYFFLSNTAYNGSLLSLLIGLILSFLIEISIFTLSFSNPFKPAYRIIYKLLILLVIAYIVTGLIQYQVSTWWVNKPGHHLSGYRYNSYFDHIMPLLMVPVTALGLYVYYQNRKEHIQELNVGIAIDEN